MSKVLYRSLDEQLETITSGMGCVLFTASGRDLLDLSSSACYASLGHSNAKVKRAIREQLFDAPDVFSGFWKSRAAEVAGELIAEIFDETKPGWFSKAIFQQGGGEAVDLACKLAAQYHAEAGFQRHRFMVRDHSFHGVGLLPFAMSGRYPRYDLIEAYHMPVLDGHVLRFPHSIHGEEGSLRSLANQLRHYNTDVAAVVIEPMNGPPTGCHVETKEYLQGIRSICNEFDVLLIFDEILCGAGRCGALSVAQLYDVYPDITILGKGITSGYQPVSVICLSEAVVERIAQGSRKVMFGTTYNAHPMGCAAVAATLRYMQERELFKQVHESGPELGRDISKVMEGTPHKVTGMGFLYGITLLHPDGGYLDAGWELHAACRKAIADLDVVVYSKGQTVYGKGDFIMIAPPFEISYPELKSGLDAVRAGIDKAVGEYVKA